MRVTLEFEVSAAPTMYYVKINHWSNKQKQNGEKNMVQ